MKVTLRNLPGLPHDFGKSSPLNPEHFVLALAPKAQSYHTTTGGKVTWSRRPSRRGVAWPVRWRIVRWFRLTRKDQTPFPPERIRQFKADSLRKITAERAKGGLRSVRKVVFVRSHNDPVRVLSTLNF